MTETSPKPATGEADELRRMLLAVLPLLGMGAASHAQDAVKSQPGSYKVAFENDRVRVLDFHSRPGLGVCGVGMHSHPAHLTVVLTPGKVKVKRPDGRQSGGENPAGLVFWSEAETHEVENVSGQDMRALLIELKVPTACKA